MSPKEIAEKILLYNGKSFLNESVELARAYLDAAKELETNNTYIPMLEERMIELNNVNQKLKEELETTKAALSELEKEKARLILHIDDIEKANDNCQTKIANLESEITKLKKSREALRKALGFYGNWVNSPDGIIHRSDCETIFVHEPLQKDKNGIIVAGKKAREALEADDNLMKEV